MRIFLDPTDYRQFIRILGDVVEQFDVLCWNYCLRPNHYHATLQPRRANLSGAVHRLNSIYALWWNRRHGQVGHVFQGRFKDQIVEQEGYLLALSRYVVMNPVRAGLVERLEDWLWSSYRATLGVCHHPPFLAPSATLRQFGEGDEQLLRTRFAEYVTGDPGDEELVDRIRSAERVLGSTGFKAAIRSAGHQDRRAGAAPPDGTSSRDRWSPEP